MEQTITENLNPTKQRFCEIMKTGDDFFRIELLRHAKEMYLKARELDIDSETVEQKLTECDKLLARERKITLVLLAVGLLAIGAYYAFIN